MSDFSVIESVKLLIEWARENKLGPLQTVSMVGGVVGLFFFSRFVRSAKKVVTDVHHVYEQALEDAEKAALSLRSQLEAERQANKRLLDEIEAERKVKEDLLRTLARVRAKAAARGE